MNFDSVLLVGFGNIGRAMVDLLLGNFDLDPRKLHIFERNYVGKTQYMGYELSVHDRTELTKENYVEILAPFLNDKTFLLNLGVEISSHDLMMLCREREAYYLDTSIEPWAYDRENDTAQIPTTNYALREAILEEKRTRSAAKTAIVAHGANPGFVSILLKKGLRKMQVDFLNRTDRPNSRECWGKLCHELGIRVIQVSERDTQTRLCARERGEFVNTWSVDGLVTECLQPAELGWGSHESQLPLGSVSHQFGCRAAIALRESGLSTRIRSWSPNTLGFDGLIVTHNEAISIADFLTVYEDGEVKYRPTSYFAYRPSDMTIESLEEVRTAGVSSIVKRTIVSDSIASGMDELGIFLISDKFPSLWLGSNLSIEKARKQAKCNNATSLQVASSIIGAMQWAVTNPNVGIVESEELDEDVLYDFVEKYWSPMVATYTEWKPDKTGLLEFENFLLSGEL